MLMVSERLGPLSSCSSSLCRSAVLVWMLLSSCSLRCLISDSSSLRSSEPEGGTETGSWVTPLDSAERGNEREKHHHVRGKEQETKLHEKWGN